MARMGGVRRMKRSKAPGFWSMSRKTKRFTIKPSPGPHPQSECYPLGILMRDILGVVKTAREERVSIVAGGVLVDGVERKDPSFPVGLMDIVEIPSVKKVYRMVPKSGSPLMPLEIPDTEKSLKLCRVKSKVTVKEGRVQYGFHDGRSLLAEDELDLSPGDSCLMEVPSQKVVNGLKMEKGALVMVVRGEKAGRVGKVEELKQGTFSRLPVATIPFDEGAVELTVDLIMVVGREKTDVQVT